MSGLVASENSGCSIDAMSSFGTTSEISRMKKSFWGCLSGSNVMVMSLTSVRYIGNQIRYFRNPPGAVNPFVSFGTQIR